MNDPNWGLAVGGWGIAFGGVAMAAIFRFVPSRNNNTKNLTAQLNETVGDDLCGARRKAIEIQVVASERLLLQRMDGLEKAIEESKQEIKCLIEKALNLEE